MAKKSVCIYLHIPVISIPQDTRIYKERKPMHRFSGRGTYFAFFTPFLKRVRSPSTKSERELGTGSSELRVKALLDTTTKHKPMEKHEHKSGRRNFSALGCLIWIPHFLLLPDSNILSQSIFQTVLQLFLLCLQSKYVAFYSAAKGLRALTIIKQDLNYSLSLTPHQTIAALPTTSASKSGM